MEWTGGCLCGAIRYAARGKPTYVGHCLGSLDRPEDIDMRAPREFEASHVFLPERIPWVHVEDDLPRFDRFPT